MWTPERIELLKQLWAQGLSAAVIGAQLEITRNAVIGKARRLDLPNRAAVRVIKKKPREYVPPRKLPLTNLGNRECRWPIGDPRHDDFAFCGNETVTGRSYCEQHCAVAYYRKAETQDAETTSSPRSE